MPHAATSAPSRSRCGVPGRVGVRQSELRGQRRRHGEAACRPAPRACPAAPPNCSTRASSKAASSRAPARGHAANQPAAFSPNVIGGAGCSSVRPSMTVPACSSESRARALRQPRVVGVENRARARRAAAPAPCRRRPGWSRRSARSGALSASMAADARRSGLRRTGSARVPDARALARDRRGVEVVRARPRARWPRRPRAGSTPTPRFGPRQRRPRSRASPASDGRVGEDRRERRRSSPRLSIRWRAHARQRSKNTVS